jgi:hypothetical protein
VPIVPALGRLRQESHEFQASLGYTVKLSQKFFLKKFTLKMLLDFYKLIGGEMTQTLYAHVNNKIKKKNFYNGRKNNPVNNVHSSDLIFKGKLQTWLII